MPKWLNGRQLVLVSFVSVSMLAIVVSPALMSVSAQEADTSVSTEEVVTVVEPSVEPTPEITPELTPEVSPEATPESTPAPSFEPTIDSEAAVDVSESPAPTFSELVVEAVEETASTPLVSPVLTTDKEDYHPGEDVSIFGSLFQATQDLVLHLFGGSVEDGNSVDTTLAVTTDDEGSFNLVTTLQDFFVPFYHLVVSNLAGDQLAETSFTDSLPTDFAQCSNKNNTAGVCKWIGSIIQQSNSVYYEGMTVPQRLLFRDFVGSGNHTITFDYSYTKGGIHAYDFLTTVDPTIANPNGAQHNNDFEPGTDTLNPCSDLSGPDATACNAFNPASPAFGVKKTITIPSDTFVSKDGDQSDKEDAYELAVGGDRYMTLYAKNGSVNTATLTSLTHSVANLADTGDSDVVVTITLNIPVGQCTNSNKCNFLLYWGGHLATGDGGDESWGAGLGSAAISGGPYHMKSIKFDGVGGSQDNQIKGADILLPDPQGAISGIKFNDVNGDGDKDPEDTPLSGWTINLSGAANATVNTGVDGTYSFADLADGVYSVCEVMQNNWLQTYPSVGGDLVACPGGTLGYSVTLSGGQLVTGKDFGNTQVAHLTLVKSLPNDNGGTATVNDWTLSASGTTPISGVSGTVAVTNATVIAGSYDLSESEGPAGYTASAWVCVGGTQNDGDTVTLTPGQSATCEITNDDQPAKLILVKNLPNDNGGTATPADFPVTLNGEAAVWGENVVDAGEYVADETEKAGYTASAWSNDCSANGSVTLLPGETKTCEITNDDDAPSLKLVKEVIGEGNASDWTLTASGPTGFNGSGPSVSNGASFDAGTYNLSESGPSGYLASDWDCVGGTQNDADTITLGLGEDAICIITNTKILSLEVSKTAATTYTRTHQWTIEKSVDDSVVDLFNGDSQDVNYDVKVTKTGYVDSDWAVTGTITISNPNSNPALFATILGVSDLVTNTGTINVVCPDVSIYPYVLPAGATLVCNYTGALDSGTEDTNTATVATEGLVPGDSGTADVIFGDPTTVVNDEIEVIDSIEGVLGETSASHTYEYTNKFICGSGEGEYEGLNNSVPNTATITQTSQSDSASVKVNCYDLTVTKDANTSFTRTWDWSVNKVGDQTDLTLSPDQTFLVNYDVTVDADSTDSDWAVAGTITISNPAPIDAELSSVTDAISGGVNAVVDCGGSSTVPAGSTLECTYTADLSDSTNRTNTATVTLDNGTQYSGNANVSFANASITEVDEQIDLTDSQYGSLGTVTSGQVPKVFEYTLEVGPYDDALCNTTQQFVNTASFTTNDSSSIGSDDHTVNVNVRCVCSLTQGYWKTHNDSFHGGAPTDPRWANLLDWDGDLAQEKENETFYLSGQTWYQVFWTAPKGNVYYNLAHQYMATKLNVLAGAWNPTIGASLAEADTLLKTYTPAQILTMKGKNATLISKQFNTLAGIFAAFNEGTTNPMGHCSDQNFQ